MNKLTEQEKARVIIIAAAYYNLDLFSKENTDFGIPLPVSESDFFLLTKAGIIKGKKIYWKKFVPYLNEALLNDLDPELDTFN